LAAALLEEATQVPEPLHGPCPRRGSGQGMRGAQVVRIWYCSTTELLLLMTCTQLQQASIMCVVSVLCARSDNEQMAITALRPCPLFQIL
jgi:hypothetical protein